MTTLTISVPTSGSSAERVPLTAVVLVSLLSKHFGVLTRRSRRSPSFLHSLVLRGAADNRVLRILRRPPELESWGVRGSSEL